MPVSQEKPLTEKPLTERFTQIAFDYITRHKYNDALEYAGNALVNCISVHGISSAKTADSHLLLGKIYLLLNDHTKAITEVRVARTIRRQLHGEKSLDCSLCDLYIGQAEYGLGNYQRAFHYYFISLYKRRLLIGDDHPLTKEAHSCVQYVRRQQQVSSSLGSPQSSSTGKHNNTVTTTNISNGKKQQDHWVHKYEVFDRLTELQWRQKHSDSLMFKLSVSLQYSLLSEQSREPCFLLSKLRKVVTDSVRGYLESKSHLQLQAARREAARGRGGGARSSSFTSTLSSVPLYSAYSSNGNGDRDDSSENDTDCSENDSANAPETTVVGSVIKIEVDDGSDSNPVPGPSNSTGAGTGSTEMLVTINNIDESVNNILALLLTLSKTFPSERLLLSSGAGAGAGSGATASPSQQQQQQQQLHVNTLTMSPGSTRHGAAATGTGIVPAGDFTATLPSPTTSSNRKNGLPVPVAMTRSSSSSSYFQSQTPSTPPSAGTPGTNEQSGLFYRQQQQQLPHQQFHLPSPTFLMNRTEADIDAEDEEEVLNDYIRCVTEGKEKQFELTHPLPPPTPPVPAPVPAPVPDSVPDPVPVPDPVRVPEVATATAAVSVTRPTRPPRSPPRPPPSTTAATTTTSAGSSPSSTRPPAQLPVRLAVTVNTAAAASSNSNINGNINRHMPGSPPLSYAASIAATTDSFSNSNDGGFKITSRVKRYPSNVSLEVGRLNSKLTDQNIHLPKFSNNTASSDNVSNQALSIEELLAMSEKATAEQRAMNLKAGGVGEVSKTSIADDLHGNWTNKRMPFRLLPHQTELETLDADGRRVVVHHAGTKVAVVLGSNKEEELNGNGDNNTSVGDVQRPLSLNNEMLRDRLQCMSATLVVAWLRARKQGLEAAASVAATTTIPPRSGRLASFVRGSIMASAKSAAAAAQAQAAATADTSNTIAAEKNKETSKDSKVEKIPRPPPLPSTWPPDFDNLDALSGGNGIGTGAAGGPTAMAGAATGGGVGALFAPAKKIEPPKVKQIQWDTVASVDGTLWEDSSTAELVDAKVLFETVEIDFSTSKPKTASKFGGGGGGGIKFSAADMLKGASALTKSKGGDGAGGGGGGGGGGDNIGANGKPKATALLDINRAQNLNIMLAKFGRFDLKDLATAVHRLDMKPPLDISAVTALQQFIPTAEEIKLISNHIKGEHSKELIAGLGKAEKYILEMGRVPLLDRRLSVMWFCMSLRETLNQLEHSAQVMLTATGEVRGSVRLRCILRVILELGNVLKNDGVIPETPLKNAPVGFKFTSLPKIIVTKSNKGENVLEYIVSRLHTTVPEMLQIDTDMPTAHEAVHVSFAKLSMELGKLKSGLQTLKDLYEYDKKYEEKEGEKPNSTDSISTSTNITEEQQLQQIMRTPTAVLTRMNEMIRDFTTMIATADQNFQESQKDFEDTLLYLGESVPSANAPNPLTPDIIFGQLCTLIKNVEVANNATIAKLKRQARQVKH